MIDKSKILSFITERGPVIPRDLSKVFGGDTFFMGAMLSQMTDAKELKISFAKIGGSPVYYLQGQEEKLKQLYNYLPGKEKEAYDLLKAKKILRDTEAEPAIRVALRSIKDFAKPLEVNMPNTTEIFWKWYLVPNQEAEKMIKEIFIPQLVKTERQAPAENTAPKEPAPEKKEEKIIPQKTVSESRPTPTIPKNTGKEDIQEKLPRPQEKQEKAKPESQLLERVIAIFSKKEIDILESNIIRKNDIEMLIKVPSPVGKLTYFCKAVDKKKINDKDLSSVFVQSQMKKLPVLYVTTGQISKKANEMLEQEFKIISILNI